MERASHESKNPRHQPETQLQTIKAIEFEDAIREYLPTQIELKNIGVLTYEQTEADVLCTVEYRNKQNKTEEVVISAKEVFENFTQKHIKSVAMFGDSFIISFEEAKKATVTHTETIPAHLSSNTTEIEQGLEPDTEETNPLTNALRRKQEIADERAQLLARLEEIKKILGKNGQQ